jgi:enoyl-CoA hydratase
VDESVVDFAIDGSVAILTLNRPKALNALDKRLMQQLASALEVADENAQVRAVIIAGSERAFCAGADITQLRTITVGETLAPQGFGRRLFDVLTEYRKPLIAAVRGLALGGGCEIALACDIVIAGASAKFGVPEVTLGLIPDAGGTQRLVYALGKSKAMRLLLTGDPMSAVDAYTAGLAAQVVSDGDCLSAAIRIAERIARNAPLAVQMAKDAARAAYATTLAQGLAHERWNFFLLFNTENMCEGVGAFLERRPPNFTGQ